MYDSVDDAQRLAIGSECAQLAYSPLVSTVIVSIDGNAPPSRVEQSLNSLVRQVYTKWEAILIVSCDVSSSCEELVQQQLGSDGRVRIVPAPADVNPNQAASLGLNAANGEYVGFIFAGDRLSDDSLYQLVSLINDGDFDLIFTDEDSVNSSGVRSDPKFKPGWDRDLLLGSNYIGQFTLLRMSLLKELGSFRADMREHAVWDMLLRVAAVTTDDRVYHLPLVCYHTFIDQNTMSTRSPRLASDLSTMSIPPNIERMICEHLEACGEPAAQLAPAAAGSDMIRVSRFLPTPPPLVTVIIPTRDQLTSLKKCVEGVLLETEYSPLELVIADNDSQEPETIEFLHKISDNPRVHVLRYPGPFNYSRINNDAVRHANGEILLLLNNDIEVISPNWLRELASHALRADVGAVGAKLLYPDYHVQHAGIVLGANDNGWTVTHMHRFAERFDRGYLDQLCVPRSLSAVTGACLAIRKELYDFVGGLDEVHFPITFNDVDLCLRLGNLGYRIIWTPFAELIHHECVSRKGGHADNLPESYSEDREHEHFKAKWGNLARTDDPFNNPNVLYGWREIMIPAFPPRIRRFGRRSKCASRSRV